MLRFCLFNVHRDVKILKKKIGLMQLSAGKPPRLSNQVCPVGTKHETHNCLEITMLAWVITCSVIMSKEFHGCCKILINFFPDAAWSDEEEALIAEFQAILATTSRNALVGAGDTLQIVVKDWLWGWKLMKLNKLSSHFLWHYWERTTFSNGTKVLFTWSC